MLKNINWKVRLNNPVFWAQLSAAIVAPMLTYAGLNWQDMTSWSAIFELLKGSVGNPVVLMSIIVAVCGIINDPTTAGLADSARAKSYEEPYKDGEA